jgi:hypothetical protein
LDPLVACRLMGKVASDKCHKWVFKEPSECEPNISNYWQSSFDAVCTVILSLSLLFLQSLLCFGGEDFAQHLAPCGASSMHGTVDYQFVVRSSRPPIYPYSQPWHGERIDGWVYRRSRVVGLVGILRCACKDNNKGQRHHARPCRGGGGSQQALHQICCSPQKKRRIGCSISSSVTY